MNVQSTPIKRKYVSWDSWMLTVDKKLFKVRGKLQRISSGVVWKPWKILNVKTFKASVIYWMLEHSVKTERVIGGMDWPHQNCLHTQWVRRPKVHWSTSLCIFTKAVLSNCRRNTDVCYLLDILVVSDLDWRVFVLLGESNLSIAVQMFAAVFEISSYFKLAMQR